MSFRFLVGLRLSHDQGNNRALAALVASMFAEGVEVADVSHSVLIRVSAEMTAQSVRLLTDPKTCGHT